MPDITYYVAVSLDGFIATPDGGVEWLAPFEFAMLPVGERFPWTAVQQ